MNHPLMNRYSNVKLPVKSMTCNPSKDAFSVPLVHVAALHNRIRKLTAELGRLAGEVGEAKRGKMLVLLLFLASQESHKEQVAEARRKVDSFTSRIREKLVDCRRQLRQTQSRLTEEVDLKERALLEIQNLQGIESDLRESLRSRSELLVSSTAKVKQQDQILIKHNQFKAMTSAERVRVKLLFFWCAQVLRVAKPTINKLSKSTQKNQYAFEFNNAY